MLFGRDGLGGIRQKGGLDMCLLSVVEGTWFLIWRLWVCEAVLFHMSRCKDAGAGSGGMLTSCDLEHDHALRFVFFTSSFLVGNLFDNCSVRMCALCCIAVCFQCT